MLQEYALLTGPLLGGQESLANSDIHVRTKELAKTKDLMRATQRRRRFHFVNYLLANWWNGLLLRALRVASHWFIKNAFSAGENHV
jgi:hypothetical protein